MSDAPALPAPAAHPSVLQLAALHHFRIYVDIAIVVVVLALTNLRRPLHHAVGQYRRSSPPPPSGWWSWCAHAAWAGPSWAWAASTGSPGAGYALAAVAVVVTVIAIGALLPWTRPMFMNNHYATLSGALIASMIIIPLQTVIPEELAFRGVLHGALDRAWGFRGVAAAGSLLFGLWHIATSLGLTSSNVGFTRIFGGGVVGTRRRCRAGACAGHRGGRLRLHLATPPQRQPDRADRAALVAERAGRAGRRPGVAPVNLTARCACGRETRGS